MPELARKVPEVVNAHHRLHRGDRGGEGAIGHCLGVRSVRLEPARRARAGFAKVQGLQEMSSEGVARAV